jgi:hypothetical protein
MIHARIDRSSSGRHVNRLRPKGKLSWSFITKAVGFRLAIGIKRWRVLVGVVG